MICPNWQRWIKPISSIYEFVGVEHEAKESAEMRKL